MRFDFSNNFKTSSILSKFSAPNDDVIEGYNYERKTFLEYEKTYASGTRGFFQINEDESDCGFKGYRVSPEELNRTTPLYHIELKDKMGSFFTKDFATKRDFLEFAEKCEPYQPFSATAAACVVERVNSLAFDLLCPVTVRTQNYKALFIDLITLPLRILTLLPRLLYAIIGTHHALDAIIKGRDQASITANFTILKPLFLKPVSVDGCAGLKISRHMNLSHSALKPRFVFSYDSREDTSWADFSSPPGPRRAAAPPKIKILQTSADIGKRLATRVSPSVDEALNFLQLAPSFSAAELGKAYRSLARKWHPDKNKGDNRGQIWLNQCKGVLEPSFNG
jgi:hypothetical protein